MASKKRAFTLVELLAVIAIIGILAGFIFASITKSIERAKVTKTRTTMESLSVALSNYKRDMGSFSAKLSNGQEMPTGILKNDTDRAKVLTFLTSKKPDGSYDRDIREDPNWNGPYLEPKTKEVKEGQLVDAWGHPLMIRIQTENFDPRLKFRPDSFEIYSWGPNEIDDGGKSSGTGVKGGLADDITNWDA